MPDAQRENETIEDLCQLFSRLEQAEIKSVKPGSADGCDRMILRGGVQWAVEHTSIDTFSRQRQMLAWVREYFHPIRDKIASAFPQSDIWIDIPATAFISGINWKKQAQPFQKECLDVLMKIPRDSEPHTNDVEGFPFKVTFSRQDGYLNPYWRIFYNPPDESLKELTDNITKAVSTKILKLSGYHRSGLPTLLILDSADATFVNPKMFSDLFAHAVSGVDMTGIEEIFLAWSGRKPAWFFPLKLRNRIYPETQKEWEQYHAYQRKLNVSAFFEGRSMPCTNTENVTPAASR